MSRYFDLGSAEIQCNWLERGDFAQKRWIPKFVLRNFASKGRNGGNCQKVPPLIGDAKSPKDFFSRPGLRGFRLGLILLLGWACAGWSASEPVLRVYARVIAQEYNWVSVALRVRNEGTVTVQNPEIGWHFDWRDQQSSFVGEIDWISRGQAVTGVEEREDFSGTVWTALQNVSLLPGDSVEFHLRLHDSSWCALDFAKDPSWIYMPSLNWDVHPMVSYRVGGVLYGAPIPRLPFPTDAVQTAVVRTEILQQSSSSLELILYLQNTGEVPLRGVELQWSFHRAVGEGILNAYLDYSQVEGAVVRVDSLSDSTGVVVIDGGNAMIPVGATREFHLRMQDDGGGAVTFADDWSWQGVYEPLGNAYVGISSDGLLIGGEIPMALDTDGDGVPDVLEVLLGSNPYNAADAPMVGVPDQPVLPDLQEPVWVSYDFSGIPGYGSRRRVAVQVNPGDYVDGVMPTVCYVGDSSLLPHLQVQGYRRSGGFFQVHAEIAGDSLIEMVLPLPDVVSRVKDTSMVMAWRYDEDDEAWQRLGVSAYDGAIHVLTHEFSTVQVGVRVADVQLAAGDAHVLWLDSAGQVWATGSNAYGQLGVPHSISGLETDSLYPVVGISRVLAGVAAGRYHSLALTFGGEVWAWGDNRYGQLGVTGVVDSSSVPQQVVFPAGTVIENIVAGDHHNFALDAQGRLWAWGRGDQGQLGLVDSAGHVVLQNQRTPVVVNWPQDSGHPVRFQVVSGGGNYSLALDSVGRLWGWGGNDHWQLSPWVSQQCAYDTAEVLWCDSVAQTADRQIYAPRALRFHDSWIKERAALGPILARWKALSAGSVSALSKRIFHYSYRMPIWGEYLQSNLTSYVSGSPSAGGNHGAYLYEWGWVESVSDTECQRVASQTLPWYDSTRLAYVVETRCSASPWRLVLNTRRLVSYGSNATGAFGVADTSATEESIQVPGAEVLAAGNGFTVLAYPDESQRAVHPGVLRILGSLGGQAYGATGGWISRATDHTAQIEILSPQDGDSLKAGTTIQVRWALNGIEQQAYAYTLPWIPDSTRGFEIIRDTVVEQDSLVDTVYVYGQWHVTISQPSEGLSMLPGTPFSVAWSVNGVEQTSALQDTMAEGGQGESVLLIRSFGDGAVVLGADTVNLSVLLKDVEILWPVDSAHVIPGATLTVQWSIDGTTQPPHEVTVPDHLADSSFWTLRQELRDSNQYLIGVDSVLLLVLDWDVSAPVVSGNLVYDGSLHRVTDSTLISLTSNYPLYMTIVTKDLNGDTSCVYSVPEELGLHGEAIQYFWNGMCDNGKWIGEGVHRFDFNMRSFVTRAYYNTGGFIPYDSSRYAWKKPENVLEYAKSRFTLIPSGDVWLLGAFGIAHKEYLSQYLFFNDSIQNWGHAIDCDQIPTLDYGGNALFRLEKYRMSGNVVKARIIVESPVISTLRSHVAYHDLLKVVAPESWVIKLKKNGSPLPWLTPLEYEWQSLVVNNDELLLTLQWDDGIAKTHQLCFEVLP